jgi:hypothetical protein
VLAADGTWNEAGRVSDEFPPEYSIVSRARVLVEGANLYLAWAVYEGEMRDLFFAEYIDGQWSSQEQLNETDGDWFAIFLAGSGGNLNLMVGNDDGGERLLWTRPVGGNWLAGEPLSLGGSPFMTGTMDEFNRVHFVWDNAESNLQYRSRTLDGAWSDISPLMAIPQACFC